MYRKVVVSRYCATCGRSIPVEDELNEERDWRRHLQRHQNARRASSSVKLQSVTTYADGGARGNPGPAAIGVVICDSKGRGLEKLGEYIQYGTNNEAEYRALIRGLELAVKYTNDEVESILDSKLVVDQMNGSDRIKDPRMRALAEEARAIAERFDRVRYWRLPRMSGKLRLADKLVSEALDAAGF